MTGPIHALSRSPLRKSWFWIVLTMVFLMPGFAFVPVAEAADAKKGKDGKADKAGESGPAETPEFTCESEIFYIWKSSYPLASAPIASGKAASQKADPEKAESAVPHREFFSRVGEVGESELTTKARLSSKLIEIQGQALEHCKRRHQERSGCIVQKTKELGPEYARMDYALRRSVLEAMNRDCESVSGLCVTPETTPIRCALTAGVAPVEAPVAVAAPAAKKTPTAAPSTASAEDEANKAQQPENPFNAPFTVQ